LEEKIMKNIRHFLLIAESLTGTPKAEINVVSFEQDENGLYSGVVEIDGNREHIHEYHN